MSKNIVIIGGAGKVALHLAKLLSPSHKVTSVIRDPAQSPTITTAGATPVVLSLEDSPASAFTAAFEEARANVVYFSAGAGGKGGEERTKAVDYGGALKVFDAIEGVSGAKPRLVLVSAVDIRDEAKVPAHYNEADRLVSERVRKAIPAYIKWKYEADKDLVKRTAFQWTIVRPGGLKDAPGTGKASIGRTHITETIAREDVAAVLAALADKPEAAGLAIDIVGGETPIEEGLNAVIKKGETDFVG